MLTADQIAAFHRDGVFVLRGALVGSVLSRLREQALSLRHLAESTLPSGTRFAPAAGGESSPHDADHTWGVDEITRPGLFDPVLIDVIGEPLMAEAMEALLDGPRAWGQKMLWAPRARDYRLHWHRDVSHAFDTILPLKPQANDHVQFNAALAYDPAFRVVPGSHRRSLTASEWAAMRADPRGPMPGEVHLPLAPGDVLLMDAHALHRGEVPAGGERLTLHFSFQAQWVPLWPWGQTDDFRWICSEAFRAALQPRARRPYERLRDAAHVDSQYGWLVDHARANGWTPPPGWQAPPRATPA